MTLFLVIFIKLIPLYLNMFLGYIAGKLLDVSRDTIARMMFYMINPLIIFNGVINTGIDGTTLSLPLLTLALSSFLCIFFYRIGRRIWSDSSKNILAFTAGSGNTGYFGLPLALILFNDHTEGVYIMSLLGVTLYENTLGYYVSAKGTQTPQECLIKALKLPTLYAFILGLCINLAEIRMPEVYLDFINHIKGAYTVLGMMIIGLGLANLTDFKIDKKFIGLTFTAKFLAWPLLVLIIIGLDSFLFHFYNQDVYHALLLLSIVPMAVNTVIIASIMKAQPEKQQLRFY